MFRTAIVAHLQVCANAERAVISQVWGAHASRLDVSGNATARNQLPTGGAGTRRGLCMASESEDLHRLTFVAYMRFGPIACCDPGGVELQRVHRLRQ